MKPGNRKRVGNTILLVMLIGAIAGMTYGAAHTRVEGALIGWKSVLGFEAIVGFGSALIIIAVNLSCGTNWRGKSR